MVSSSPSSPPETTTTTPDPSAIGEIALDRMKRRDLTMKVVSSCGRYRISAVTTTNIVQSIIDKHDLHGSDAPFLNLLGTHVSFANLLAAMGEGEERVECRFESEFGAACVAESLALGECRSYVAKGSSEMILPNTLVIKRALYNHRTPVTSATSASFESELPEEVLRDSLRFMGAPSWDNADAQSTTNDQMWARYAGPAEKRARIGFQLNMTPHAVHYFKQSEGIPSAVLLTTSVEDVPTTFSGEASYDDNEEIATRKLVVHSGGVLVQPLAHNMERNNDIPLAISKLQKLFNGMTLCPVPPTVGSVAMAAIDDRNTSDGILLMDLLSLASGDYQGAMVAAKKARVAFSDDVETTQTQYQLIREPYGLKVAPAPPQSAEVDNNNTPTTTSSSTRTETADAASTPAVIEDDGTFISLNTETVVRTALDFTCRCSADSFRDAILTLPETKKEYSEAGVTAVCIFCNKEYEVIPPSATTGGVTPSTTTSADASTPPTKTTQ